MSIDKFIDTLNYIAPNIDSSTAWYVKICKDENAEKSLIGTVVFMPK